MSSSANPLHQTYIIAKNTFKQLSQGKILLQTLLLALVLMLICFVATRFTYGVPHRVALDVGLGLLTISSAILALSLGVGLITDEITSRTLYIILSRAVPRSVFLLGKALGLTTIMAVNILILGIATVVSYVSLGGTLNSLILWSMFYILLEAELLLIITVFFSLIANKSLTIVFTVALWFMGHAVYDVLESVFVKAQPALKQLLEYYAYIFPAFYKINLKDFVLYEQSMPLSYLFSGVGYVVLYATALLFFSCFIFQKKNLD